RDAFETVTQWLADDVKFAAEMKRREEQGLPLFEPRPADSDPLSIRMGTVDPKEVITDPSPLKPWERGPTKESRAYKTVVEYLEWQEELHLRGGPTVLAKITLGVSELPAYMVDFLATSGIAGLASKGARRFAIRMLGAHMARKKIPRMFVQGVGWVAGATARTGAMPTRILAGVSERTLPQYQLTEKGELLKVAEGEDPFRAILKATGDVFIENLSETAGPGLAKAGRKLAKIKGLRWTKNFGGKFKTAIGAKGLARLEKVGWNGFVAEMGEEELGRV
ncbi:unnamed protein product, partial [marine sediment metagenome]